ncbi:MAG: hypothetical protein M3R54_10125 [Chloroflexota bacterium]|nr:hypothetical protein [Chloroflexota bacterium]
MLPFVGAIALLAVLALLLVGERAFDRWRRPRKPPKQLPGPAESTRDRLS